MNKWWTAFLGLFLCSAVSLAETPAEKVKSVSDALIAKLEAEKAAIKVNPNLTQTIVKELVVPHFDARRMARAVLAKHRDAASAVQQDRFTEEFTAYLVRYYANAFANYNGEKIKIEKKVESNGDKGATVKTNILRSSGPNVPVDYKMAKQEDGSWKIIDVSIEGVGLVQTNRDDYNKDIAKKGLDKVIEELAAKNRPPATK